MICESSKRSTLENISAQWFFLVASPVANYAFCKQDIEIEPREESVSVDQVQPSFWISHVSVQHCSTPLLSWSVGHRAQKPSALVRPVADGPLDEAHEPNGVSLLDPRVCLKTAAFLLEEFSGDILSALSSEEERGTLKVPNFQAALCSARGSGSLVGLCFLCRIDLCCPLLVDRFYLPFRRPV